MNILRKLLNQKGAMFGMDARVALIIASVLAATGGVTMMSKIESNRVEAAKRGVNVLRDAIFSYYETVDLSTIPADIATLFASGVIDESVLSEDPWGNAWEYNILSETNTIKGISFTTHYAVLHSRGKDATDSSVAVASTAEYASWEPAGDDIGIKFNTIEIEKKRVELYSKLGDTIVNALNMYESSKYLLAEAMCSQGGTDPSNVDCENSSKLYSEYNYYPESSPQGAGGGATAVYYNNVTSAATSFTSGDTTDMEALMTEINLPTSYATDPWGKVLSFESNATGRNEAPFGASVWYE